MALSAGTRLGPYEIVAPLGAGGMGEVYRARDTTLNRDIAIKVLPDLFASDPERLARFEREAQMLAAINHPNIAQIYGLHESSGLRALVMELVQGPTLADRITGGPIPLNEAIPIAKQIADALDAAHEKGIVHRDLKPANIKITPEDVVKVLDFGLAKAVSDDASSPDTTPSGVRRLLRRCLEKDPRQRLRDIGDARADLTQDWEIEGITRRGVFAPSWTGKTVTAMAALSIAAIAGSVALGFWLRPRPSSDARPVPVRFSVPPPQGGAFAGDVERTYLALSPDGSQLAFIAAEGAGGRRIWLRSVSTIDSRPVSGTEGASSLFWSPDGRSIAFFAGNKLKRLDLPEGAAVPLCDVSENIGLSGTWGAAGEILFASVEGDAIFSVSTAGRTPVALIKPDRSRGERRVNWPWFLPDGRRFLYLTSVLNWPAEIERR